MNGVPRIVANGSDYCWQGSEDRCRFCGDQILRTKTCSASCTAGPAFVDTEELKVTLIDMLDNPRSLMVKIVGNGVDGFYDQQQTAGKAGKYLYYVWILEDAENQ